MESMPALDAQVGDQPLRGHVDDETPLVQELVDSVGIPPIQVKYSVGDLSHFGQCGDHVVHHHVVEDHVDIESERDELEGQGNE